MDVIEGLETVLSIWLFPPFSKAFGRSYLRNKSRNLVKGAISMLQAWRLIAIDPDGCVQVYAKGASTSASQLC